MNALLAADEPWGGNFEVPPVGELFNFEGFEPFGQALAINRVVLIIFTATLIAILLFGLGLRNPKVVPGKLQNIAESLIDVVRNQIAIPIIGHEGHRYVPVLTTLFIFIWFNNLFEVIPFVNFPSTSRTALPIMLGVLVLFFYVGVGFKHQGVGWLKEIAFPPGVPKPIYLILTPIEIISTFVLRPFTLAVRLFANMVAGHILLTIVFLAVHAFFYPSVPGIFVGILVLAVSPVAVGFEMFIATLQAYIFAILASTYIAGALEPEH